MPSYASKNNERLLKYMGCDTSNVFDTTTQAYRSNKPTTMRNATHTTQHDSPLRSHIFTLLRCLQHPFVSTFRATHLVAPLIFLFFFNDTATTEIYTLSLHDALPFFFKEHAPHLHSHFSLLCRLPL